jgi:hypothetical protein
VRYRAIVYLQCVSHNLINRIGEIDVEPLPRGSRLQRDCYVKFMHHGRLELGRVQKIQPDGWERTGATPTIHTHWWLLPWEQLGETRS